MFGDPLCPVCRRMWPKVSQVIEHYKNNISFRLHLLPLPYHTWAFVVSRVAFAVKTIDEEKAKKMLDLLYKGDQSIFSNGNLKYFGENESTKIIIKRTSNNINLTVDEIRNAYDNPNVSMEARIDYKLAGFHRVASTPTIFVNGAEAPLYAETLFSQWKAYIDDLLKE